MVARKQNYHAIIDTPLGRLGICASELLTRIDFLTSKQSTYRPSTPLAREVCAQLKAYWLDAQQRFDLPIGLAGSDYQKRVWRALSRIPPGKRLTYGELARKLNSGARAIGGACRANPIPIVVPCHRIVAQTGLGGYLGNRLALPTDVKAWLLQHEAR